MDWKPQPRITRHDYIPDDEHMEQIDCLTTLFWIAVLAVILIAVEVSIWQALGGTA